MTSESQIREVVRLYTEGTYEGSTEKLGRCFHEKAVMNGYLQDQPILGTPEPFIQQLQANPVKDAGTDYQWEISGLDIDGQVATVILKETGFPGGISFTNYFHLIDDGAGWKIISKTFCSHQNVSS